MYKEDKFVEKFEDLKESDEFISDSTPLKFVEYEGNSSNDQMPTGVVFTDLINHQIEKEIKIDEPDDSGGESVTSSELPALSESLKPPAPKLSKQVNALPRFIDLLLKNKVINMEMVASAIEIHRKDDQKRRLLDILIEDLAVDRDVIFKYVARHYSFETVNATSVFGNKDKLQFIKKHLQSLHPFFYELAVRRKILPFELYTNGVDKLIVITPDPTHPDVSKVAKAFKYRKAEIKYISLGEFNELWRQLAFDQGLKSGGLDFSDEFMQVSKMEYESELERSIDESVGHGKLAELVESIMVDGVRTGASDIHVVPRAALRTEFHFRIDGRLTIWSTVSDVRAEGILAVVKDRAKNLDRFEKFLSQDGFAQRTVDNQVVRFRFSTMPIYGGDLKNKLESIVIRILRGGDVIAGLDSLGMDKHTSDNFNKSIRKTQGIIVITGPTGSGKSTTQLSAIKMIIDPALNIVTIEDPVEYLIDGCRQVKLNHKLDFESALRGLLRHDPDVVMVGEMRDKVSADIAVKLANTGHLVFSTLHTNDSISAITRLYNMGIEPFLLAYTINVIVAQRLLRKLCERCKTVDEDLNYELLLDLGIEEEIIKGTKFYKPVGCIRCIKGYRGRIGIFEALKMSKEMRQVILRSKDLIDEDALRTLALKNGMITLKQSAINLATSGVTSLHEITGIAMEN
ncbi:MAG: GspE/PulE family protein [Bacteroidota bacterium]|nr:GspE/PulE family protein [Bacteroidota bacterium]